MKLLALVQKRVGLSPGQRFRLEQWAPILAEKYGIELQFEAFESPEMSRILYQPGHQLRKAALLLKDGLRRVGILRKARAYDGIVIYREATLLGGSYLEWAIRRLLRVPFIYDFDDAIWEVTPSARNGPLSLIRAPWKTRAVCRMAGAVTVGNEFLASYARQVNTDVNIVRTSIDLSRFTPQPERNGGLFTIVWTGSHSTLQHLERLRDVFRQVGAKVPTLVRVVCDERPPDFANVENEFVPWSPEMEVTGLCNANVGVMPLPDSLSARGKCGCKALQYMALSLPAVVSPVGINREIITDGVNGLLATSDVEWVDALLRLANDATLRHRLGVEGRATVERGYSAEAAASDFAAVVNRAISTGGSRSLSSANRVLE